MDSSFRSSVRKRTWPPHSDNAPFREISDVVHGSIPLYYPLNLIIDTPEFQRLRAIKQTGAVYLVYPSAEHSRFTHSLGTQHLARLFVKALTEKSHSNIDCRDQLCVAIAGLCHDLGHGPFSHIYDTHILPIINPDTSWTHEKGSVQIFNRILTYESVKKALDEFLEPEDYIFIEELIDPPRVKFNEKGEWQYKGRAVEKSFLYDLICNVNDSLDVDKYDYLLRDSLHTAVAIPFNLSTVERIREWMMPLEVNDESSPLACKFLRLCYSYKVLNDLHSVGESRYQLHSKVYNHHAVRSCENLLVRAIISAAPFLKFLGDNGTEYSLGNIVDNVGAFLSCDDSIFQTIMNSTSPELGEARYYIDFLLHRRLPRFVGGAELLNGSPANEETIKKAIMEYVDADIISQKDFIISVRKLHCGMGTEKSPMAAVLLYNHKSITKAVEAYPLGKNWLMRNPRFVGGNVSINVYVPYEVYKEREWVAADVYKAFSKALNKSGCLYPMISKLLSKDEENNESGIYMESEYKCL